MGKSTEDSAVVRVLAVADNLCAEVGFEEDESGKMIPRVSVDDILSKFFALLVYSGLVVGPFGSPNYNRVHADVDFWARKFKEAENNNASANGKPKEEVPVAEGSIKEG